MAGKSERREIALLTTLDGNAIARFVFVGRIGVEDFKEKLKTGFDLEVILAANSKSAKVENRVWSYI